MPTNRFGYSDDFVLNNGNVGINSAIPQEKLDVAGSVRGDNVRIAGVSSFTTYEGFLNANQNIVENINLEAGQGITGSLSGEIIVGTGITVTGIGSATSGQGYIDSLKVYNTFTVPSGGTLDRPSKAKPGQLYYNRDFATIEFYTGTVWRQVDNTTQRGRGVFMGGQTPSLLSSMEYVNIHSGGNGINFGTLAQGGTQYTAGCSSSTRGILGGGYNPAATPSAVSDTIEYITIASEGNSIDFGNLSDARGELDGCSSSTRGVFCGGEDIPFANMNVIDYIEIATLGNALDFGDMNTATRDTACLSSPTRGIIAGGVAADRTNRIESFTIAAKGNSVYFGDLTSVKNIGNGGCSNSVRGLFAGGQVPYTINVIDSITIASNGNAQDFGDLSQSRNNVGSVSTQIRGMWGGGYGAPAFRNNIDYVTIASTGNAQDFGDLTSPRNQHSACSDSHGGLGGF